MVQARWYNEDTGTWEKFIVSNEGIQGPPGPLPDEDKIVRDLKEKVETEVEPLMLSLSQAELARQEAEGKREAEFGEWLEYAYSLNPGDGSGVDLSSYATKNYVDTAVSNVPIPDLSNYALKSHTHSEYALKSQVKTDVPVGAKFTDTTYTAGTGINITGDVISATGGGGDGYDDTAIWTQINRVPEYVASRGQNLVTNGTGLLKDNTNFSGTIFDGSDNYGSNGSFTYSKYRGTLLQDELIPIDPSETYRFAYYIKANPYVGAKAHGVVACFDSDGQMIEPHHTMYRQNTLTELVQDLKPGDTKVYLEDVSNWYNDGTAGDSYLRTIILWNYVNQTGYQYPPLTYSRNAWLDMWDPGAIDFTENSITLKEPWDKDVVVAGTKLSNGSSGGAFKYVAGLNFIIPENWERYSGAISGIDTTGTNYDHSFHPGTASIKIGWLLNRDIEGSKSWLTNISFGLDRGSEGDSSVEVEMAINVRSYGAAGDGETDDSEAIQRAIQDLPKENGVLYFPPGEYIQGDGTNPHYVLDSDGNFVMEQEDDIGKDIRFVFDGYKNLTIYGAGAVVKAHPDNSNIKNNEGFVFLNSENVYVEGLTYDGSIESRKPTALDIWKFNTQYGFRIQNTKNMLLTNVTSDNTVMDGFFIASGSSDITLVQCKGRYNYRQGASVVKANRVRFYGCDFSYTGTLYGTLPKTGIDVEDDPREDRENRDVLIEGCLFKDNAGDGVVLHLGTQNSIIRDNTFINNRVVVASDNLFEIRNNDIVGNSFINGGIHARGGGEYIANNIFKINKPTEALYVSVPENFKGKQSRNVIVENNSVEVELPSPSTLGDELYGSITLNQGEITYKNNTHLNINGKTSVAFRGSNIQVLDNEWRFDDDRYAESDVTNFIFASSLVKYANNKVSSLYGSLIGNEKSLNLSHEGWTTNVFRVYDLTQSSAVDLYIPKNSEVVELTISGTYHDLNNYGVRKEILTPNAQPKKTLLMGTKTMVQNGVRISSVYEKEGKDCITLFAEKQPGYFFIKVDVLLNGHITPSYIKNDWHLTSAYTYDTSSNLDFKTVYHSSLNWTGKSYERPSAENGFDDILEGAMFYDTTIKKPIWWNGENWVDVSGETQ